MKKVVDAYSCVMIASNEVIPAQVRVRGMEARSSVEIFTCDKEAKKQQKGFLGRTKPKYEEA